MKADGWSAWRHNIGREFHRSAPRKETENMPYLVLAAGKEIDEKDCPLVRLSVQVAADCRVTIEESRGLVSLLIHRNTKTKSRKLRRDSSGPAFRSSKTVRYAPYSACQIAQAPNLCLLVCSCMASKSSTSKRPLLWSGVARMVGQAMHCKPFWSIPVLEQRARNAPWAFECPNLPPKPATTVQPLAGPFLWNTLPSDVRGITQYHQFKQACPPFCLASSSTHYWTLQESLNVCGTPQYQSCAVYRLPVVVF